MDNPVYEQPKKLASQLFGTPEISIPGVLIQPSWAAGLQRSHDSHATRAYTATEAIMPFQATDVWRRRGATESTCLKQLDQRTI